jgi:hypothetical protein
MMHAATLASVRLQRVLALLSDGRPHTTRAINRKAQVCAVNAIISELRVRGAEITCVKQAAKNTRGWRWYYTMTKAPDLK